MKKLLEYLMYLAVGLGLGWLISRDKAVFPDSFWPQYLLGLLIIFALIGINDVRKWRYWHKVRRFADESWFLVLWNDPAPACTCKTQHYGGLCRIHQPFFW